LIPVSCRARITSGDLQFLTSALGGTAGERSALGELCRDPAALDRLLDDPVLFSRLLEAPRLLRVSPWFFYYVLVRRAFLDHGIDDARVADYVGALLSFHLQRRASTPRAGGGVYLVDLVMAMAEARSAEDAFVLQTEIGDVALYLAGVFPDWIHHRERYGRRPVSLAWYEEMGSRYYGAAADSAPAARHDLGHVLSTLAGRFPILRQALNDLVDEHLHLAPRPATVDAICRRALFRVRN